MHALHTHMPPYKEGKEWVNKDRRSAISEHNILEE
jgi:hypothetical protein